MSILLSFIEIYLVFTIYNMFSEKNNNTVKDLLCTLGFGLTFIALTLMGGVDSFISMVVILIITAVVISKDEGQDTLLVCFKLITSMIILFIIELILSAFIMNCVKDIYVSLWIFFFTLLAVMLFCKIILYKAIGKYRKSIDDYFNMKSNFYVVVVNLFIFFLFIKILIKNKLFNVDTIFQVLLLCLILVILNISYIVKITKKIRREKKLELKESISPLIEQLMSDMRAREHEYKNHLNILYGMIQVSPQDELRIKARKYIGNINSDEDILARLSYVQNTIIKAILYSKLIEAEKKGIYCDIYIESELTSIPLDDSELTILMSNLLNNAIEATAKTEDKDIYLYMLEKDGENIISIKNPSENLSKDNISKLIEEGFSTKGENRGFGLSNIKNIVDKYKGKMQISLEGNMFEVKITI